MQFLLFLIPSLVSIPLIFSNNSSSLHAVLHPSPSVSPTLSFPYFPFLFNPSFPLSYFPLLLNPSLPFSYFPFSIHLSHFPIFLSFSSPFQFSFSLSLHSLLRPLSSSCLLCLPLFSFPFLAPVLPLSVRSLRQRSLVPPPRQRVLKWKSYTHAAARPVRRKDSQLSY